MFSRKQISPDEESWANSIKRAREEKGLKLEDVSQRLRISQSHLSAIEDENLNSLPSGVYRRTFIKKYASFLGLNTQKIMESYERTAFKEKNGSNLFGRKVIKKSSLLVFPKIIRNIVAIVAIAGVFLYLGFYLKNSLSKPKIEIFEPADNLITEDSFTYVSGRAKEKTMIEINDRPILKLKDGSFRELVELKKGMNTITISAQNKYSQKNIIKKQILVK